jgi:hypothetical protein
MSIIPLSDQAYYDGEFCYPVDKILELTKDIKPVKVDVSVLYEKINHPVKKVFGSIKKMYEFIEHVDRIMNADLKYPIIAFSEDNDICDGCHRIAKAKIIGRSKLNVIYINKDMIKHLKVDPSIYE